CKTFLVHARKAWLQGLSPRENREVPPLRYENVYRLKQDFPHLEIVINGGVTDLTQAGAHLQRVDGVMMGRAVYHQPWLLAEADRRIFGIEQAPASRRTVVLGMREFVERELARGIPLHRLTRHMLGLFQGLPGARHWRRHLSEQANHPGAGWHTLLEAMERVREPTP
ncbi:MAG: tRNA dihydrouridine(20/20a) synthase DusA, partial [Gammaproteobacteria bacterium]